jgi:hypothetical protein
MTMGEPQECSVNLLDRRKSKSHRFFILAPVNASVPGAFRNRWNDSEIYDQILADMQRMRGRIALCEGAVGKDDLDEDGRHHMAGDEKSWHLIRMGTNGEVLGCARILVHSTSARFPTLRLASSSLAKDPEWSRQLRWTVESDIAVARKKNWTLLEPGGWVLDERLRGSSEATTIALSAIAWSQLMGECLAYITATVKHGSSSMMRRLGGESVRFGGNEMPRYYEPHYQSEMELLKLQTRALNPKFDSMLAPLRHSLATATVLQPDSECGTLGQWAA